MVKTVFLYAPTVTIAKVARKKNGGRKDKMIKAVLRGKYGPGRVPEHISTETLRQEVRATTGENVSWDSVDRARNTL